MDQKDNKNKTNPEENNSHKHELLTFKEWVYELLQDERGHVSVKPVIALLGALFLCGTLIANAITDFNPSDSIIDAVMVITSIGMGADSIDKFSRRRTSMREFDNYGYQDGRYKGDYRRNKKTNGTNIIINNEYDPSAGEVSPEEASKLDV